MKAQGRRDKCKLHKIVLENAIFGGFFQTFSFWITNPCFLVSHQVSILMVGQFKKSIEIAYRTCQSQYVVRPAWNIRLNVKAEKMYFREYKN